jgi:hypothetical protein
MKIDSPDVPSGRDQEIWKPTSDHEKDWFQVILNPDWHVNDRAD